MFDHEKIRAYTLVKEERIEELNSQAYILTHNKSGARVFLLANDDENKVFTIGFRTPPEDSTGIPHILEHSVLCGSKKFPAKDPFVELVKGSLNTFLNAMTYPDKTVYPVASCNDQDFRNLVDVYMDAVLHPNIYENPKIFMQEGWHFELEDEKAPLRINGVVYNEMKGAFSSPESVLERYISNCLYPDTPYGFESGGDPDEIPKLGYEKFLQFHKTYYHPSNSFIYLYGNMDMEEYLNWLDEAYLGHYGYQEISSEIGYQKPFDAPRDETIFYPITEEEDGEEGTYLSVNTVVGTDLDPELYVAFQILEYALLGAPGAPLKQALLDAGVGSDVFGGYESGILQPYFSVIAKGAREGQKQEFLDIVHRTLETLAEGGINPRSLLAGLNFYEFKYREGDYGHYPKGLMYGLQCFDSWLYDDRNPLMHLKYRHTFDVLKERVRKGYFERLIREYLLDNPHSAVVSVVPKKGLLAEREAALADKLAAYKASLSPEKIKALVAQTRELKRYQEEPSSPEALAAIPLLTRGDIKKEAAPYYNTEKQVAGVTVLHHSLFTAGIGYLHLMFDTEGMTEEELLYTGLLKAVLGYVDTGHYSYQELFDEINIHTGGMSMSVSTYDSSQDDSFTGVYNLYVKALYDEMDFTFALVKEVLFTSKIEDEKRLREIIGELRSRAQMRIQNAGHQTAALRAASYYSQSACYSELVGGIAFYRFVEALEKHFDEKKEEIIKGLRHVMGLLFTRDNLTVSFTADEEGYQVLPVPLENLIGLLPRQGTKREGYALTPVKKNEGFKCSSQVQYVAASGNFRKAGLAYRGTLKILKVILDYDYLWLRLRVKGGAYGCMSGFGRSGESYLVSYRDPNLGKTLETYRALPEYIKSFDADEREMTKYIIGAISGLDIPKNPMENGARSLAAWMTGLSYETIQKERDEILSAASEDIRALAPIVEAVLEEGAICVVGNDGKIEEERELFGHVENLFH